MRSKGQIADPDSLTRAFNRYRAENLQEKIFLHTDRNSYVAGEILWFKVYNTDASFHKPLSISSVGYLEILDEGNKPVLQTKVSLSEGKGNGSLYLPVSLVSGNYRIRTYTRWMKNYSADLFFEKRITIINTLKEQKSDMKVPADKYDVQFFPEGGNMVAGIENRVAFRITDQTGKGVKFEGVVVDEAGNKIVSFSPLRSGIGSFLLKPRPGIRYKSVIVFSDGRTLEQALPGTLERGYVMSLKDKKDSVIIDLSSNIPEGDAVYLFAHAANKIEFGSRIILNRGRKQVSFSKDELHEGITHFTLFDQNTKPVCERLYFNALKESRLQLSSKSDSADYGSRKRVSVDIQASTISSIPAIADLSLSVYRADSLQQESSPSILSYLYLGSELRGNVEDPEYYVTNDNPEASVALDNLMLTHGWRRFKWEEVLSPQPLLPEFIPETSFHIVTARLFDKSNRLPVRDVPFSLSIAGRVNQFYSGTSTSDGKINFFTKDLVGNHPLILQTSTNNQGYSIEITNPFSDKFSSRLLPKLTLLDNTTGTLLVNSINMQAWNIYNRRRLNKFTESDVRSLPFYGSIKERYLLDDYVRFPTIEEVLREYVLSVGVRRREGKLVMQVYSGVVNESFFDEQPLVLLDGVPILKSEKLFSFDPLKVKSIEVLPKRYFFGTEVYGGIILFKTYKNNLEGMELDANASVIDYEGLQQSREFYSPRYDTAEALKSRLPDFRNLLFWAPDVITDKAGNAKVSFYTSDRNGLYIVDIQGITSEGKAGSFRFSFNVN